MILSINIKIDNFDKKIVIGNNNIFISLKVDEFYYEDDNNIFVLDTYHYFNGNDNFNKTVKKVIKKINRKETFLIKLLSSNYFILHINKINMKISLYRDPSGIKTGYYFNDFCNKKFIAGNNMHEIAFNLNIKEFDKKNIYKFLYTNYLFDGDSFYKEIFEVKIGEIIDFYFNYKKLNKNKIKLPIINKENKESIEVNKLMIKKNILKVFTNSFSKRENIIFLSGGLDSNIMAINLKNILSDLSLISFFVKNTDENETPFALEVADELKLPIKIFEKNPEDKLKNQFEIFSLNMNLPYIGTIIFSNIDGGLNKTYYMGQDTRLHTPDFSIIDYIAFLLKFDIKKCRFLKKVQIKLISLLNKFKSDRKIRGLIKVFYLLDFNDYLEKYFFKLDKNYYSDLGISTFYYDDVIKFYKLNKSILKKSNRIIYNEVVKIKWKEQYISDIRYIQDMAKLKKTYIALPFYDFYLNEFFSQIPFKQAGKFSIGFGKFNKIPKIVNKFLLRKTYENDVNKKILFRDKAVSNTTSLLFGGDLGNVVKNILLLDLKSKNSFIKKYKLSKFVYRFIEMNVYKKKDSIVLMKIYNIASLIVIYEWLNNEK
ncbi:MAG: asparagine synthase-related protein [Candidatus Muirbacterium halophilum]|nr:asparagine synthase-related protein [Candidatus Muirbacterium halophilum]